MSTITVYATGDQIATYESLTFKGNSNGSQVQIQGAQTLGSSTDVFRIVIRQVSPGQLDFANGQFVDIYAYPDTSDPPVPLYSSLNPQHDQFQGRASSEGHQVFTQPAKIIFDVNGFSDLPDFRYGPGLEPNRAGQLDFDAFSSTPPVVPCFVAGSLIETKTGPLPVEILKPGDLIRTLDNGLQPIRWIGQRTVPGHGAFAPILLRAGAVGNYRNLLVSPQHRFLTSDWRSEMYFGTSQVLVAAKHLVNGRTILPAPRASVQYFHLMFDRHEIIFAEGAATESLHLGETVYGGLAEEARTEVLALFPQLREKPMPSARTCLKAWEGRLIA